MKFRNRNDIKNGNPSPAGSRVRIIYGERIDSNGRRYLYEKGTEDIYEKIQENKDTCDLNRIVQRYLLGDESVLNRYTPSFIDATGMPTSLAEAQNSIIRITEEFFTLPLDIRKKFDNSPEKFINSWGSPEFREIFEIKPNNESVDNLKLEKENFKVE